MEIVYEFSNELNDFHSVTDRTYARMVAKCGEQGMMDLVGLNGYYSMISMVLNVGRTPLPPGNTLGSSRSRSRRLLAGIRIGCSGLARRGSRCTSRRPLSHVRSTSPPPPIRSTSSGATRRRTIARSSAFCARARSPLVASPASSIDRIAARCHGTPSGSLRPERSIPPLHRAADRSPRPSLDPWTRSRGAAAHPPAHARAKRGPSSASSSPGDDAAAPDVAPCARGVLDASPAKRISRPHTAECRSAPGSATSFRAHPAGSACKRLNLFLRWMVRRDAIDLGTWTLLSPSQAHHSARHARHPARSLPSIDWRYATPGWRDGRRNHGRRSARLMLTDPVRCDFPYVMWG